MSLLGLRPKRQTRIALIENLPLNLTARHKTTRTMSTSLHGAKTELIRPNDNYKLAYYKDLKDTDGASTFRHRNIFNELGVEKAFTERKSLLGLPTAL